ncbi:Pentapeptide repeat-containing protein [Bradyrhizobium lablabi]|uniref:Pentapeptide repeat-containing protein n=1 Tax=Bradyrhizobium lablabi TaxID=722472 RepID=A0A1M7FAL1_9BRAD|nr:pentapeptide repeat-containing protein [Bradyrhizobium lablabi]SHM01056.1 Pentapeptide repeat-containing protein [Bradyrhizobium lablabi]
MGTVQRAIKFIRSDASKHLAKVGTFTLAVTVVSYWVSFQDRAASRQESAWATLRAAIVWTQQGDKKNWGNVGQLAAIETLTRHCSAWWRGTFVQSTFEIIFPDCIDLNSLSLERMELGALKGSGANFSHSNLACTNLAKADLRNATLDGSNFSGAYLGGTDFRGASLEDYPDFNLTNVSWIQFDTGTKIDPDRLKCACVDQNKGTDGRFYRQIQNSLPTRLSDVLNRVNICPSNTNTCEPHVQKNWKCVE